MRVLFSTAALVLFVEVAIATITNAPANARPFNCPTEGVVPNQTALEEKVAKAIEERRWDDLRVVLEEIEPTGDPAALYTLSSLYAIDFGAFPSQEARHKKIIDLMTKSAFCNDGDALVSLAGMYRRGEFGLEPSEATARCIIDEAWIQGRSITVCGIPAPEVDE